MGRSNFSGYHGYYVVPSSPKAGANFRRTNLIIIWSLVFLVLGVFALAFTPEPGHAFFAVHNVPPKIGANSAAAPGQLDRRRSTEIGKKGICLEFSTTQGMNCGAAAAPKER